MRRCAAYAGHRACSQLTLSPRLSATHAAVKQARAEQKEAQAGLQQATESFQVRPQCVSGQAYGRLTWLWWLQKRAAFPRMVWLEGQHTWLQRRVAGATASLATVASVRALIDTPRDPQSLRTWSTPCRFDSTNATGTASGSQKRRLLPRSHQCRLWRARTPPIQATLSTHQWQTIHRLRRSLCNQIVVPATRGSATPIVLRGQVAATSTGGRLLRALLDEMLPQQLWGRGLPMLQRQRQRVSTSSLQRPQRVCRGTTQPTRARSRSRLAPCSLRDRIPGRAHPSGASTRRIDLQARPHRPPRHEAST